LALFPAKLPKRAKIAPKKRLKSPRQGAFLSPNAPLSSLAAAGGQKTERLIAPALGPATAG